MLEFSTKFKRQMATIAKVMAELTDGITKAAFGPMVEALVTRAPASRGDHG